ncbi:hypothetical protein CC85DRAFT_281514, partial [Cutaneotrichosporon oleaginosum]
MIECGECGNWFHFSCVDLSDDEAEKIHNWVCPDCAERTGAKTTYIHDISTFPSPAPPSDVEVVAEEGIEAEPASRSKPKQKKAAPKRKAAAQRPTRKKAKIEEPNSEPVDAADQSEEDNDEASSSESESAEDEFEEGDADDYKDEGAREDGDLDDLVVDEEEVKKEMDEESPTPAKSPVKRGTRGRSKSATRDHTKSPIKSPIKSPGNKKRKEEATDEASDEAHPTAKGDAKKEVRPATRPPAPKRPSIDTRRSSGSARSGAATPSVSKEAKGALPAARAYVLAQFTKIATGLFGDKLDASGIDSWAREVEAALFTHFKEGPKAVAGNRYKAQFTLLNSSLPKTRAEVKNAIVDGATPPSKVALMTAEDLATEEQLAELMAQRAESLRQAVRIEPEYNSVRIGRDGFEEVENEKDDDDRAEDRKDVVVDIAPTTPVEERRRGTATPEPPKGSETPRSPLARRRSSFSTPLSPIARRASFSQSGSPVVTHRPSVEFTSAWGTSSKVTEDYIMEQDQDQIDLSDLATGEAEVTYDDELDGPDVMAEFLQRPVVWSGGITNPAEESPFPPPVMMRQAAGRAAPADTFRVLLPQQSIAIAGRVPSASSLRYLADRRLDRTKELMVVAFSLDPKATPDQRGAWEALLNFHIQRDRHAVFHPNTTARELYLIPLRAADRTPELFDTLDAFALPKQGRTQAVMLGVFVAQRASPGRSPAEPQHTPPLPVRPPPPAPQPPHVPPPAPAGAPVFQNAQLQALMASLNPAAIAAATAPSAPAQAMPLPPFPPFPPGASRPPGPPDLSGPPGPPGPPPRSDYGYRHEHQPDHRPEYRSDGRADYRPGPGYVHGHGPPHSGPPYGAPQGPPYGAQQGYPPSRSGHVSPPGRGGMSPATEMRSPPYGPPRGGRGGGPRGRGRGRGRW